MSADAINPCDNLDPAAATSCEDLAYTRQFFTLTRQGHTRPTAEFGAPTLVWHVSFWPRSGKDPHDVVMATNSAPPSIIEEKDVLAEHSRCCIDVSNDFNKLLTRLQCRGRAPDAAIETQPFKLHQPADWESSETPFEVFGQETTGFTLWWADRPPPAKDNMMAGRGLRHPDNADLRVRVQAEMNKDYASITFFVDAGKPWGQPPTYGVADAAKRGIGGDRRKTIWEHVENIKTICESRIDGVDHLGQRLIDLDLLPEPNPVSGATQIKLHGTSTDSAEALKNAADYLYKTLWDDFCTDFGFNLCDVAGKTDEVFANFRGLVMSTSGATAAQSGLKGASAAENPAATASPGSKPFERFDGGGDGYETSKTEPNAVVKAFMPFMRRFRPEADWRDWIASGIFDWRAIYITAIGAQSEFSPFDECDFNTGTSIPADLPAGQLPARRLRSQGYQDPKALPECSSFADKRSVPTTPDLGADLPAPFRYLLLTKHEPNRKQVGRMIERINTTGARRLFALKNWSIIQQASIWISYYGRQLDTVYQQWIEEARELREKVYEPNLDQFNTSFWQPIDRNIAALPPAGGRKIVETTRKRYRDTPRRACEELELLAATYGSQARADWDKIKKFAHENKDKDHPSLRSIEGDYDADLAAINQKAERQLIRITAGLDRVGFGAVGGLPFRIARSRYYADMYRQTVKTLRVGNIETWWSYDQFATRGMEPALQQIDSVGKRMDALRQRLGAVKQDILQSSIASQTEATRDNTHRLERIQAELRRLADGAEKAREAAAKREKLYWTLAIFGGGALGFMKLWNML